MSEAVKQVEKISFVSKGFETPAGSRIAPIYEEVFDEELKKKVVKKTGEFDLYEEIQMSSNGSEIAMLKKQAKASGVPIENDPGLVGGMNQTLYPSNIHEAMNYSKNVNEAFARLPKEIQEGVFGGDASKYLNAVLDGSVNTAIGSYFTKKSQPKVPAGTTEGEGGQE